MSKRPAFMFYPADWRNNAKLRRCSWAARGVWIEIMGLLHDSDSYGVLHWSLKEIALAVGCPLSLVKELADKDVLKGCDKGTCDAFIYTPVSGRKKGAPIILVGEENSPIWYSSRMVLDEYRRGNNGGTGRFSSENNPKKPSPSHSPSQRQGERQGDENDIQNTSPSRRHGERLSDGLSYSYSFSYSNNQSLSQDLKELETDVGDGIKPDKPPEKPPKRSAEIAILLRKKGVKPMTSVHPQAVEWAGDERVTNAILEAAIETARQYKPDGNISPNYLKPIISQLIEPPVPTTEKAVTDAWWTSNDGIDRKGRELGITAKPMENYPEYKQRIFNEIRSRKEVTA